MAKKKAKKKKVGDHTIELQDGVGVVPDPQPVSKSRHDRVRWWNRDGRAHVLSFDEWPFVELPQDISLNPGQKSRWFKVYDGQPSRGYTYSVVPAITGGPPDGPQVSVGD
jgi:hypothetical protein